MSINYFQAMKGWGKMLRSYYGKTSASRETDFVNNYLGYWTDNGTRILTVCFKTSEIFKVT